MNTEITSRLYGLLNYIHHLGKCNQKPIFRIDEYKQSIIWEHQTKGSLGIKHNIEDLDGPIWLRIERLKRTLPPSIPEQIQEWVNIDDTTENYPQIKNKLIKTLSEKESEALIKEGLVNEDDITNPLKDQNTESTQLILFGNCISEFSKDVMFRLENNQKMKIEIDNYINKQWLPWSEEEKLRRETIKIYNHYNNKLITYN